MEFAKTILETRIDRLIAKIEELEGRLRLHRATSWADWLAEGANLLKNGREMEGLEHILSGFGGMGTLNDLILSPLNGHQIGEAEERPVNSLVQKLSSAIYALAWSIRR